MLPALPARGGTRHRHSLKHLKPSPVAVITTATRRAGYQAHRTANQLEVVAARFVGEVVIRPGVGGLPLVGMMVERPDQRPRIQLLRIVPPARPEFWQRRFRFCL